MRTALTVFASVVVLAAGLVAAWVIFQTEPTAERSESVRESAMLVEVVEVERGDFRPVVPALGTVEPAVEITLSAQVSGLVTEIADNLAPGAVVAEGDTLLRIETADYRNALALAESELARARSDLAIEQGRQTVARLDLELLDEAIPESNRALVLREPQLQAAEARVSAARTAVEQARVDLSRTEVRAPFDALVLERNANLGSLIGAGEPVARLVDTSAYWVVATVPQSALRWLTFEGQTPESTEVRVSNRAAWPDGVSRTGTLLRTVGALDGQTRMARLLVEVPDPLGLDGSGEGLAALTVGAFVDVAIPARVLHDVVRVPLPLVRAEDRVWVEVDGHLDVREVEVQFRDATYAYVTAGMDGGERVVATNLSVVVDGAPLRVEGEDPIPPIEGTTGDSEQGP